jgi:hypothetical protein
MNVTKLLGLAAVGGLLVLAVPAERAQALSLATPGVAAGTVVDGSQMTTEVRWGRRWGGRRWGGGHRRHWRRW